MPKASSALNWALLAADVIGAGLPKATPPLAEAPQPFRTRQARSRRLLLATIPRHPKPSPADI